MYQWIINGEIRAVIAVNVDRFFRDKWVTEYSKSMELCEKYHVIIVTPDLVYDFSDGYCIKSFRDKCILAWEYPEYQVYKRMSGAKDYLGKTGRYAGEISRQDILLIEIKEKPMAKEAKLLSSRRNSCLYPYFCRASSS